jgi:hypothetical protein
MLRKRRVKSFDSYYAIIEDLLTQRDKIDEEYDKDCYYGTFVDIQDEWFKKINRELKLLEAY